MLPTDTRATPASANTGSGGVPGRVSTLIGAPTSSTTRVMSSSDISAGAYKQSAPASRYATSLAIVSSRSATPCRRFSARAVRTRSADAERAAATRSTAALDRTDLAGARIPVLDREAGGVGGVEQPNGLDHTLDGVGEAILGVDVERHVDTCRQHPHVVEQLVALHVLIVAAERPGVAGARGRQRLETEGGEDLGRADVPRIRHRQDAGRRLERRIGVQ